MRLESRELAYITITETKAIRDGMAGYYDEFVPVAVRYVEPLPEALLGQPTHLALSCWLEAGVSGRLRRCLLIGKLRDPVCRVRNELLDA